MNRDILVRLREPYQPTEVRNFTGDVTIQLTSAYGGNGAPFSPLACNTPAPVDRSAAALCEGGATPAASTTPGRLG